MKVIDILVNEKYDLNDHRLNLINKIVLIKDGIMMGINEGTMKFKLNDEEYQVNVYAENKELDRNFEICYGRFSNKKLLVLGDSVSARLTIGLENKTYSMLLQDELNLKEVDNQAIGGTTLTYMYEGSNVDKEYHSHEVAIDGCRVVSRLADQNKLHDVDYVIIAYGHNDQHFKDEIEEENNTNVRYLEQCHSYKNSFRYIVNTLRNHNKNVRVIVINCTYSEYDKTGNSPYPNKYGYQDYRNANKEMAEELNLKYVDPWDYMKQFFDFRENAFYYMDAVHLTKEGHKELFKFLLNK